MGGNFIFRNKTQLTNDGLHELLYIKFTWVFLLVGLFDLIYYYYMNITFTAATFTHIIVPYFILLTVGCFLNFIKLKLVESGTLFYKNHLYLALKLMEIAFITAGGVLSQRQWPLILIIFPMFIATVIKGIRIGLCLVISYVLLFFTFGLLRNGAVKIFNLENLYLYSLFVTVLLLFVILCGMVNKSIYRGQTEKEKLHQELKEKYEQLAAAQAEIKTNYDMLKDSNIKLENTNKKLTGTVAEFYTLQQITQAISSIFDIKELLKFVNDVIIGVMGVNYSSIAIYEPSKNRLNVQATNIVNPTELAILSDNVNCSMLREVLSSGHAIMDNFVDPKKFVFTQNREINSIICIPLYTKSRQFGLVLVEHKHSKAFDDDNVRLLKIIGQQVGIALENAELYQKMQELATIDGLTGIYNRLYFQERLEKEFLEAQAGNYPLSLAIFDIDHFKKFNDTYGHLFGDKVLKYITALVKGMLRKSDIFARFGGEEFVFLFPHTNLDEAFSKVENIRKKIEKAEIMDNLVTAHVTVSFGVSSFPQAAMTDNELIRTADNALYEAKAAGRNCVRSSRTE